ncbi:MAG TPA: hypothetical protein VI854_03125, partial [Acidimicrobiia bacterium]|nr:hypothetical protein [Acidimicrobiia bacterium]
MRRHLLRRAALAAILPAAAGGAPSATLTPISPVSQGYWMVASDGGIFAFGDAGFYGAAPQRATRPGDVRKITSMVPTASGLGYWQMSATGEVLAFGDAADLGGPASLNQPLVAMAATPSRSGLAEPAPGGPDEDPSRTTTTAPLLTPAQKGRPNVVVILMDDMRVEGVMDHPDVMPKTKQWLVEGGTTLTDAGYTPPAPGYAFDGQSFLPGQPPRRSPSRSTTTSPPTRGSCRTCWPTGTRPTTPTWPTCRP